VQTYHENETVDMDGWDEYFFFQDLSFLAPLLLLCCNIRAPDTRVGPFAKSVLGTLDAFLVFVWSLGFGKASCHLQLLGCGQIQFSSFRSFMHGFLGKKGKTQTLMRGGMLSRGE
jgi:hypothetical protein